MPGQSSSSSPSGDTDPGTDRASNTTTSSSSILWAPHGRGMTACLIVVNVVLVALVYLYFWRVFSRKSSASPPSGAMDHDDDASSTASTPPLSSPRTSQDQHERLVASLPTFVARSGSGGGAGVVECAVCLAELRDGDEGRALPRCGHRFHAACVDAWLRRRHTTCPLCRASVVVLAAEAAGPKGSGVTDTPTTAAAAAHEDMDAPV